MARTASSVVLVALCAAASAPSTVAQTRTESMDALRGALSRGDSIALARDPDERLSGRLLRMGERDLEIRITMAGRPQDVTVALDAIRWLERRRDSVTNGAIVGAAVGAGIWGTLFAVAVAVDRNEMDEWAPGYLRAGAAIVGLGAALGAAIDLAHSKPRLRFDRHPTARQSVRIGAVVSRSPALGLTVSF